MEPAADESLAAIRARSKLGMAMAAMTRMIATTIRSSISEKPFCFGMAVMSVCCIGRRELLSRRPLPKELSHLRGQTSLHGVPYGGNHSPSNELNRSCQPAPRTNSEGRGFESAALRLCTLPQVLGNETRA